MKKLITKFITCVALAIPMLMIYSSPASAEYNYQVVIPPGYEFASARGINDAEKVTGFAWVGFGETFISFIYDMKSGEYTTISDVFVALEISNSGVMVGDVDFSCAIRDKKGNIIYIRPPSYTDDSFCQARGVNLNGKVSGWVSLGFRDEIGFIYDSKDGTYEEFLPSWRTNPQAINAQGQNVGSARYAANGAFPGSPRGHFGYLRQTDGSVKYFAISQSLPGQTRARGISESGLITGFYLDPNTFELKSYVTTLSNGAEFEIITLTSDQMVYQKPCDTNVPPPPGPDYDLFTDMTAQQIRNDGVVVGSCLDYYFNASTGHAIFYDRGFIATPIK